MGSLMVWLAGAAVGLVALRVLALRVRHDLDRPLALRRLGVEVLVYAPAVAAWLGVLVGLWYVLHELGLIGNLFLSSVYAAPFGVVVFAVMLLFVLPFVPLVLFAAFVVGTWPARELRRRGAVDRLAGTSIDRPWKVR